VSYFNDAFFPPGSRRLEQAAAIDEVDAVRQRLVVVVVGPVDVVGTTVRHRLGTT
jgi:hypothetical protein